MTYITILVSIGVLLSTSCTKNDFPKADRLSGLVVNEVCGAATEGGDSWVELLNTTEKPMDISGIRIFLTDSDDSFTCIYKAPKKSLAAGGRLILSSASGELSKGFAPEASLEILLTSADQTKVDYFVRDNDITRVKAHSADGSYSRLPDGTGKWYVTPFATRGGKNFGYSNRNAFWLWSTHMKSVPLSTLAARGYGHIILHEQAFKSNPEADVLDFIANAEALGMTVHIWIQCFYNGTWVSPVDDANQCYDQALFDSIITRAEGYLDKGIKAIHLDYIRFGGTAYKHNLSEEVNGEGAITEFCRQISARLKAKNGHVILSAAIMPEKQGIYYYGQNTEAMGQYIDVLMPMIYRYAANGSNSGGAWARNMADYFAEKSGKAEVWAGLQTYNYVSGAASGLSQEAIYNDCADFLTSAADGIVLFRYGLGNFPDVTKLWK